MFKKQKHDEFRRCENCGGALVRITEDQLARHLSHRMRPCSWFTLTELIKITFGWL